MLHLRSCQLNCILAGYGPQEEHVSWWPKHSQWSKSGHCVGIWTSDCETWFTRRLQEIREGKTTPRTSVQWRNALNFNKKAPKLMKNNEVASKEFLERFTAA